MVTSITERSVIECWHRISHHNTDSPLNFNSFPLEIQTSASKRITHEQKKHPKKICIKNFGGTLAGGSRRGLRRPNSLCRCWFSQRNTVHKEFRGGGGSKGVLGVGSKVQFWGPISLCLCAFLGLELLGGRFGYFLFFSAWGRGRGSPGRREGRGATFIENRRRGGGGRSPGRLGGGRGAGRVFAGNFWGGGALNISFRGRNSHQDKFCDHSATTVINPGGSP